MNGPGNDREVEIRSLRGGEESLGADVLAASHAEYPAFRAVFPDPGRRSRALRPFFRATVRDAIPFGSVLAALEGRRARAVAVWLPPGAFPWSTRRKL